MASGDDAEVWVALAGRSDEVRHCRVHVVKRGREASMDYTAIAQVSVGGDSLQAADDFNTRSAQFEPRGSNLLVGETGPVICSLESDNDDFLCWVHSHVTTGARTVIGAAGCK